MLESLMARTMDGSDDAVTAAMCTRMHIYQGHKFRRSANCAFFRSHPVVGAPTSQASGTVLPA